MTAQLDQPAWTTTQCPACTGGGLAPAVGCTCDGNKHTCAPVVCNVCGGAGQRRLDSRQHNSGS